MGYKLSSKPKRKSIENRTEAALTFQFNVHVAEQLMGVELDPDGLRV